MDSFEGGLVNGKILALSDRNHFHNHFLFDNPIDDSGPLLCHIEFVISGEIEACPIAQVLAKKGGCLKFLELLGNRFSQGPIELSKVVGSLCCEGYPIRQDVVSSINRRG